MSLGSGHLGLHDQAVSLNRSESQTRPPPAKVTERACAKFEPSRATSAVTVTMSPFFSVYLVQPCCISVLGLPSSNSHLAVLPLGSTTSNSKWACGFSH